MDAWELARYIGYEALFVIAPGWLLLRALAPGIRSRAWQLALGWPLGLTLEILAFALTAAIGARDLFLAYPVVVAFAAALIIRRRESDATPGPVAPGPLLTPLAQWGIAALTLLVFAYIGGAYFALTPLPGSAAGVFYPGDTTFQISIAASALHHWPPAFTGVSGLSFHYHYFVDLHMAGAAQVTGLDVPLIVFRLYLIPLIALVLLQVGLAGRLIGGGAWAGVIAVGLFALVQEVDLSISDTWPFGGGPDRIWGSASQLLGMCLFVPAAVIVALLLDPALRARAAPQLVTSRAALWVILAILLVGAGGAKGVTLPVIVGGLILYLAWTRLLRGRFDRAALSALALSVVVFAAMYLLMYRGTTAGLTIDPPGTITQMPPLERLHDAWPGGGLADAAYWVSAVVIGTAMYFGAPLLGLGLWLRRRPIRSLDPAPLLAISMLVTGAGAFFFLRDEYIEQTYITQFGIVAVLPFAAAGIAEFVSERFGAGVRNRLGVVLLGAAWIAALSYLAVHADHLAGEGHPSRADLLAYGPALLGIAVLLLGAALLRPRLGAMAASAAVVAVLIAAALNNPLDLIPRSVRYLQDDQPLYATSPTGLRPKTLEGMEWIRDNLPEDAIVAVSNDRTRRTRHLGPIDGSFPALTERFTLREAWAYTGRGNRIGVDAVIHGRRDPFPERTDLERAAFTRADPAAIRAMVDRYGVTEIVVSRKDGEVDPGLYRLGRLIYSNGALDVIELPRSGQ